MSPNERSISNILFFLLTKPAGSYAIGLPAQRPWRRAVSSMVKPWNIPESPREALGKN